MRLQHNLANLFSLRTVQIQVFIMEIKFQSSSVYIDFFFSFLFYFKPICHLLVQVQIRRLPKPVIAMVYFLLAICLFAV